jgi:hypothetical protein
LAGLFTPFHPSVFINSLRKYSLRAHHKSGHGNRAINETDKVSVLKEHMATEEKDQHGNELMRKFKC